MNWRKTKEKAAALLGIAYDREVERLAEELRPRFESGELGGHRGSDDDAALLRLQEEARVRSLTPQDAAVLLAVTPTPPELYDYCHDIESCAIVAFALDVLRVALGRGWYCPAKGEEPSAQDLAA